MSALVAYPQAMPVLTVQRPAKGAETAAAVPGPREGEAARNDMPDLLRKGEAQPWHGDRSDGAVDPRLPAGPPPAFEANLLEVEQARLRALAKGEAAPGEAGAEAKAAVEAEGGQTAGGLVDAGRVDDGRPQDDAAYGPDHAASRNAGAEAPAYRTGEAVSAYGDARPLAEAMQRLDITR